MYIVKTNMSKESTTAWREELNLEFPTFREYTDQGLFDYLFSCTHVELVDLERTINEYA